MANTTSLPFWPSSLDCISWSQDNVIAVVGGENIAILTPRLKDFGASNKYWDTAIVQINTFTAAEVPLHEPLSNKAFAIGDELSVRQAVSAKWSWPGLGRHRACVLAILTADHTLSIWALEGNHKNSKNWKRQIIVNKAVRDYYAELATDEDIDDPRSRDEQAQVQQRIISFAWSQPIRKDNPDDRMDWGKQFLAVAAEGGDILFLRVDSPYESPSLGPAHWNICVTGSLNISASTVIQEATGSIPQERYRAATELEWGKWDPHEDYGSVANLAYIVNGKLFTVLIRSSQGNDTLVIDALNQQDGRWQWHLQDRCDVSGPLRYVRAADRPDAFVACGDNAILYIPMDWSAMAQNLTKSHHLDDRWDKVSGFALTGIGCTNIRLHLTSELLSATAVTSALTLPFSCGVNEQAPAPSWQNAIRSSSAAYSADLDLAGNVLTRTCGIAHSPFGDYIATCAFFQPSDAVAYVIEADRSCVLSISQDYETSEGTILPPLSSFNAPRSVELALFCIQRHLERQRLEESQPSDDKGVRRRALEEEVLRFFQNVSSETAHKIESNPNLKVLGAEALIKHTRRHLHTNSKAQAIRASRIVNFAMNPCSKYRTFDGVIIQQLLETVLKLPSNKLVMDESSLRIKRLFEIISTKLGLQAVANFETSADAPMEICQICGQEVRFESLRWARCLRGHQYSRCALSFIAIQQPGTTKSCGICGLQYLDEICLESFSASGNDINMLDTPLPQSHASTSAPDTGVEISHNAHSSTTSKTTLAQLLFTACDFCIHCGGRYTDGS